MGTPVEINPLELSSSRAGYQISRSVRLRSSASAYLNRTITTATSQITWTWSGWVKRGTLGVTQQLFGSFASSTTNFGGLQFNASDGLTYTDYTSVIVGQIVTSAAYRDPSAWYHIVLIYDAGNATASNRIRLYVNGVQVTAFSSTTNPPLNSTSFWNGASYNPMNVGALGYNNVRVNYFDGYLAEVNFIDGQALTASSFGYTDSNGIWQPKAYTGTYGTNGFYLKFTDNSAATAAAIGKDYSGNGNNWTPNNISVTAGTTYDSMVDSPTVGYAASNYPVLNPLSKGAASTYANGNLQVVTGLATSANFATIQIPNSGKWYWEYVGTATGDRCYCGIANSANTISVAYYGFDGNKYINGTGSAYGATYTTNDVIGVAVDVNSGSITFYKNNVSQGAITQTIAGNQFFPYFADGAGGFSSTIEVNFGQRPFTYTPPSGFAALNTYNLPAATINNGATVMAASTYTGNGATQSIANSGNNAAAVSFKPDLVWVKSRSAATDHKLTDSVRGATKALISDTTGAETTDANGLTAFGTNGFTLGTDTNYNNNTATYVGWQWQAGQGTTSSNTNGSITSTVSVNQSAGFSIVTYATNGVAGATVGHGLGVAPKMIIIKDRNGVGNWTVYHASIGNTNFLQLNTTIASTANATVWNNTSPTSAVFSLGTSFTAGFNEVAYCWSEVAGYSKFGSYTGNASADGPFVYLGFRPRFVMIKNASDGTATWIMWDSSRDTYNVERYQLYPNQSAAEVTDATNNTLDFLSNGFKYRGASSVGNGSGNTIIYAAFAENPFNISRAR